MARSRTRSKTGSRPKAADLPAARTDPRVVRIAIVAGLLLVTCWAYSTSFRGVFLEGDDQDAIVRNPHVRTVWPPAVPLTAPPDTTLAGRPVASLSFALNYAAAPAEVRNVMKPPREGQ